MLQERHTTLSRQRSIETSSQCLQAGDFARVSRGIALDQVVAQHGEGKQATSRGRRGRRSGRGAGHESLRVTVSCYPESPGERHGMRARRDGGAGARSANTDSQAFAHSRPTRVFAGARLSHPTHLSWNAAGDRDSRSRRRARRRRGSRRGGSRAPATPGRKVTERFSVLPHQQFVCASHTKAPAQSGSCNAR